MKNSLYAIFDLDSQDFVSTQNNEGMEIIETFFTKNDAKYIMDQDFKKGEAKIVRLEFQMFDCL